jgi:hypothetical protein
MSDLFDAAAERIAIATGRPKSQELAELRGAPSAPAPPADGFPFAITVEGERFDVTFAPARKIMRPAAPKEARPLCESPWCRPWPAQTRKRAKYEIAVPGHERTRFMCGQHATYYRNKYGRRCARILP